jgi:hypothetical protein
MGRETGLNLQYRRVVAEVGRRRVAVADGRAVMTAIPARHLCVRHVATARESPAPALVIAPGPGPVRRLRSCRRLPRRAPARPRRLPLSLTSPRLDRGTF